MGDVGSTQDARATAPRMAHVPALDGLRGAAVAAVLWFHAGHLTGGYLGVDLFFVLSGYLITSLLVIEWDGSGGIDLRAFWGRRARRLLPALFAVLVVVGIAARSQVLPVARGQLRGAGLATLAYVANWYAIVSGNGYWDRALAPSWLEHTWSLAIEEQFYVLWPLVALFVLRRAGVRGLGRVAAVGAVASAGLMVAGSFAGWSTERLYLGTDTRVAAILLGAVVACLQRSGRSEPTGTRREVLAGAAVASVAVLGVAWTGLEGTSDQLYRGGLLVCGVAAVVVIADVTTPGRSVVAPFLSLAPLCWLGTISYGLYLWHWPIFQYLHPGRFGLTGWTLVAVRMAASVAVAVASLVLLERPVLERRWPIPLGPLVPVGMALAAVALLVGTQGAIDPVPASGEGTASKVLPGREDDPTVLVVGDSVAYALAEDGLIPEADEGSGLRVVDRASIGCTIMRDVDDPVDEVIRNCSPAWPGDVAEVQPDVAVLLLGGFAGVVPVPVDGRDVWPCEPAFDARWRERLTDAVDVLGADGATVVLVSAPTTSLAVVKGEDPERFDARQACTNRVLEQVVRDHPGVVLADLAAWTCPAWPTCRTEVDGVELRADGVHFNDEGARVVARWLTPQLLAAAGP
ncbi:MAG: acyltransferase [Actinobacteria bacterium]|nr:acyltransferase [Actinomycetota bacterium]